MPVQRRAKTDGRVALKNFDRYIQRGFGGQTALLFCFSYFDILKFLPDLLQQNLSAFQFFQNLHIRKKTNWFFFQSYLYHLFSIFKNYFLCGFNNISTYSIIGFWLECCLTIYWSQKENIRQFQFNWLAFCLILAFDIYNEGTIQWISHH